TTIALPDAEGFKQCWAVLKHRLGMPKNILSYCTHDHFVAELRDEGSGRAVLEAVKAATERTRRSYVLREVTLASLNTTAKEFGMKRDLLVAALVCIAAQGSIQELESQVEKRKQALKVLRGCLPQLAAVKERVTEVFEGQRVSCSDEEDQDPLQRAICAPIEQLEDIEDYVGDYIDDEVGLNLKFFESEGYLL
ncbi:hypothetical protein ACFL6X_07005, partial [Candidatus Latescibacterota bacterium]